MDLSGVFCVADSGVLQDTFLWNSIGMHTCSVWFSNRYGSRNHVDDRANGNDNGPYKNDVAGRPAASNASRIQDRFDDDGRRADLEINQRNGGSLVNLFMFEWDNDSLFSFQQEK